MSGERLMIVEDEAIVAMDLKRRVEKLGFEVVAHVPSGEEAVEQAWEKAPDLVLMDIRLGKGMDGIMAADIIRRKFVIPVIYLTANSDRVTLERAKTTEPHGYILKPVRDRELEVAIEMALYRHKADMALRESREWFSAMLRCVEDAVIANDRDGVVRFMNAAAERLTGWREEEAQGRPITEVVRFLDLKSMPGLSTPESTGAARQMLSTGRHLSGRAEAERGAGADKVLQVSSMDTGVEGTILSLRDVTEKRNLEQQLAQKQRMESIGRLAAGVAHDFNNLLTAIIGFSSLLKARMSADDPLLPDVLSIVESGERAAGLTRQLLAFSRQQVLMPTVIDLGALARNMDTLLRRIIGGGIELQTHVEEPLWTVKVDPGQMEQVLMNLVVNARDAMPKGGKVTIELRNMWIEEGFFPPGEELPSGKYIVLAVADTGIGMTARVKSQIFEPFFTTKPLGEGTGLGLATSYGIVKQSGGHIAVQSEPGMGSTFRVYLPACQEGCPGETTLPTGKAPQEVARGTEFILLLESDTLVKSFFRQALERSGFHVLEAQGLEDALEFVHQHGERIRLLINELPLTGLGGNDFTGRIRSHLPGLQVLLVSGHPDGSLLHQGLIREGLAFLRKPFGPAELTQTVRKLLDTAEWRQENRSPTGKAG